MPNLHFFFGANLMHIWLEIICLQYISLVKPYVSFMFHKNLQIYRLFIASIYLGGTPVPGIKSVAINVKTGVVFPTHR